jgi:hypothetical protein
MAVIIAFNSTSKKRIRSELRVGTFCQVIEFPIPELERVDLLNPFSLWRDVLRAWSLPS